VGVSGPKVKVEDATIAVIGLGYVGLPLAVEFGKKLDVIGFDINPRRIAELQAGTDRTLEVSSAELGEAAGLRFTTDPQDMASANVFIVTTPTPIDEAKRPDLRPLLAASESIGKVLSPGGVVVYESTVYPGATEEECVPVLEKFSGLTFNQDFFVGYSPERINPGDKEHRVHSIVKVTSGSTPEAADFVDDLYGLIITAGTHKAPSIKVAEAAKVIENTQRDVNIALVNELAMLFDKLDIDTHDVLEAAGTKWNFLPFKPGLVGGHCIGVDPYYLTHKAQMVGHHPEMILAGRRINDSMGAYVASQMVKKMVQEGIQIKGSRVLVLGLAFKENTPDLRNTKVVDVIRELEDYGVRVDVHDPMVDPDEALALYDIELVPLLQEDIYDAVFLAVAHHQFNDLRGNYAGLVKSDGYVIHSLTNLLVDKEGLDVGSL
jgi:UDP-N-acetyl-D-galactosamine dehydrogenase